MCTKSGPDRRASPVRWAVPHGRSRPRPYRRPGPHRRPQTPARPCPQRPGTTSRASPRQIVDDVRTRGDDAVRELHRALRRLHRRRPRGRRERSATPRSTASTRTLRVALEFARDQIVAWHEAQREKEARHERSGIHVRELVVPVDRAGCYVPGGRAPLASSVLMTAIPARVAGVPAVAMCSPPRPDGTIDDAVLAASALAEVDELYRIGGAQAIAALAYGTESVPAVDVIVGPGNAYVAEAKRAVAAVVGIDGFAGPSEVAIVADATVDPMLVAADLLAQAEHGPGRRGRGHHVGRDGRRRRSTRALEQLLDDDSTSRRRRCDARIGRPARARRRTRAGDRRRQRDRARAPRAHVCRRRAPRSAGAARRRGVRRGRRAGGDRRLRRRRQPRAADRRERRASRAPCASPTSRSTCTSCRSTTARSARVAPFVRTLAESEGLAAHADALRVREDRLREPSDG